MSAAVAARLNQLINGADMLAHVTMWPHFPRPTVTPGSYGYSKFERVRAANMTVGDIPWSMLRVHSSDFKLLDVARGACEECVAIPWRCAGIPGRV